MRKLAILLLGVFIFAGMVSCTQKDKNKVQKSQKAQQLYEKYKTMITEGNGCEPCIDCAALALAISYDTSEEITLRKKNLTEYFKKNGKIPCPELVPELKQNVAQVQNEK